MSIFQLATVLIYVTSVLTSSVNQISNNDRNTPYPALDRLSGSSQIPTKDSMLSTESRVINKNVSDTLSKSRTTDPIMMTEGGGVVPKTEMETKSSTTGDSSNKDEPSPGLKPYEEIIPDGHPKKSSIHPRKGAIPEKEESVGNKDIESLEDSSTKSSTDTQMLNTIKSSTEFSVETKSVSPVIENAKDKSSQNDINLDKKPEANSTKHVPTVLYVKSNNSTTHKRKPTSTTGEGDDDGKGMPSSPTQKEIGMPKKVDYIVPLVITIMATPVLGIAAFILYTRGRDCWDKRHYRRMDFLVEGMYND